MKGIILLNGEPYCGEIDVADAFVVCADGAKRWADEKGVRIDALLGDFDSLGYVPEGAVVYPAEKDFTDGELALSLLIEKNVDKIEIYGGSGKREDHFFGNVALIIKAEQLGVKAEFVSDYTSFTVESGKVFLNNKKGTLISLFPIGASAHIDNSKGFKYTLDNLTLNLGEARGLSNVVTEDEAFFNVSEGKVILFIVRKA